MFDYRAEIDGLRAIAVLAVIVFHANAAVVPGGFLGVDVFFVISGYLITSLILADIRKNEFSLKAFYERRARRILPALFVVLAATIPVVALWLLPSRQENFAQSLLATVLFSSNFLFWSRTSYFMDEAETEPLLHTWSLAIEEQFYLIYPLLILLLWRTGPRIRYVALGLLFASSLSMSVLLAQHAPAANFYLLPSRAWELLAGALLACGPNMSLRPLWSSAAAGLGLGMVLVSFFLLGPGTPMPSAWTLIPVGGTVLMLGFGTCQTWVGRFLAQPLLVLVGLMSYGAYLWHWPILVFARLRWGEELSAPLLIGLVALTFLLAYATWRFVEQPFRRRGATALVPLRTLSLLSITVMAALVALVQLPTLLASDARARTTLLTPTEIDAKLVLNFGLGEECEDAFTLSPNCRTSESPKVLLWGDSYAMHLAPAIALGDAEAGMIQHTKSACTPAIGISAVTPDYPASWAEGCIAFNDQVLEWLETQPDIQLVVVSSILGLIEWDVYQRGGQIAPGPRPDLVRDALLATAERVRVMGKDFVIVSPTPTSGENIGECLTRAAAQDGQESACDFSWSRTDASVFGFLEDLSRDIPVVFLDELICKDDVCDTRIGNIFMYRSRGHLSIEGSRYLEDGYGLYSRLMAAASK